MTPLSTETQWLREYACTYLPCDGAFQYAPEMLRRRGVYLIDLICLFRSAFVVSADKIDSHWAVWIVEGEDCDGNELRAELLVHTQEMRLKLEDVERLNHDQGPNNDAA